MKPFLKKIIVLIAVILSTSVTINLFYPVTTHAVDDCEDRKILYLKTWDCNIKKEPTNEDDIKNNAIIIATNILSDISAIAGYLVLGYIIYGGYLYIFAAGDPSKVAAGKKTLVHAFIGFSIAILANVIINSVRIALLGESGVFSYSCDLNDPAGCQNSTTGTSLIINMLSWAIGMAGVVAVIFIVIGGISYVTSAGNPNQVQKAKQTIMYALIGLAIVGLAEIIMAVVSNILTESKTVSINTNPSTEIVSSIDNDHQISLKKGTL